jgi:hypothetical protein
MNWEIEMQQNYANYWVELYIANYRRYMNYGVVGIIIIGLLLIYMSIPSDNYQHGNALVACFTVLIVCLIGTVASFSQAFQYKQRAEWTSQYYQNLDNNWASYWDWYYRNSSRKK